MIDETTTRAVQRILAMRLAARGGCYNVQMQDWETWLCGGKK